MIYQFLIMGILASPLAFFVLKKLCSKKQRKKLVQNQQINCRVIPAYEDCRTKNKGKSDVIIVGAGVAGSSLAYALGKDGRKVHIIERDLTMPIRMVGEVLQPGGYLKLLELGLEDCVLGIDAQQVFGYVIYKEGKYVRLPYPLKGFNPDVAGKSFHNGRFVQRLREKAASLPSVKMEQGTVLDLVRQKDSVKGVRYKTRTGREVEAIADLTIICDGYYSNLRRRLYSHKDKIRVNSHFVGWTLDNCQLSFPNHAYILLAEPSTVLVYQISNTETRCFVNIPGHTTPSISNGEMSHYLKNVLAPQIPPELYEVFMSTVDKVNLRTIPYWDMTTMALPTTGAFIIGDAFNTRHPFSGGGMTVALSDVVVLRDLIRRLRSLDDASAVHHHLQSFYTLRRPMAVTMNTLGVVLQAVFCSESSELSSAVKEASFRFLSLGGVCENASMSLVSGLNPNPSTMLLLFLAVALHNLGLLLLPFPSFKGLKLGLKIILRASTVIFTVLKADGVNRLSLPNKRDQPFSHFD